MRRAAHFVVVALLELLAALPCRAQQDEGAAGQRRGRDREAPAEATEPSTATIERCVLEHDRARMLRLDEQWMEARAAMSRCSLEGCPLAIRSDCRAWLEEVAQALPTLLIIVERDDGGGRPVLATIDGGPTFQLSDLAHPIEVLPGRHRLRFVLDPYAPIENEISVEKGEKNRLVKVRFIRGPSPSSVPLLGASAPPVKRESSRPIPLSTYLLAGAALAAAATSTGLLVSALSMRGNARATCAPVCGSDVRQAVELRLRFADLSGGLGLLLGAFSAYTLVSRPVVYSAAPGGSSPAHAAAAISFAGTF